MMTKQTRDFIREHVNLIDSNSWNEFYDLMVKNQNFQLLIQIGEVTKFVMDCGCNPLAYLNRIPTGFLAGCNDIDTIVIPEGIKGIDLGAFRGCQNLKRVTLPKSCNEIGTNAFFYCSSLEEVYINSTNQYFGDNVFDACPKLQYIHYSGTIDEYLENPCHDSTIVVLCKDGEVTVDDGGNVVRA